MSIKLQLPIICSILASSILLGSCKHKERFSFPDLKFKTETIVPHSSVKNQGEWPAGWIYATLSMIESDRMAVADSLQLSATFLERMQCEEIVGKSRMEGWQKKFETFAGTPFRCLELAKSHGLLTYQTFRPKLATTWGQLREQIEELPQDESYKERSQILMDTSFAYLPNFISLYGATYTSKDLMNSVLTGNYSAVAMTPQKGMGAIFPFILGDAANASYNIAKTPDEMVSFIEQTLRKKHTLVWMGDTAIASYSSTRGLALESQATGFQTAEQTKYLQRIAAEPLHALHLVGIAACTGKGFFDKNDDDSKVFFIAKDSHGTNTDKHGYIYLSENFIKAHTAAIYFLSGQK